MFTIFKAATYLITISGFFYCGYWQLRLKRELTDKYIPPIKMVSELGIKQSLSEGMMRERILKELPKASVAKFKRVVALKFLFMAMLALEVILLQR
jgi:hypothetical protein